MCGTLFGTHGVSDARRCVYHVNVRVRAIHRNKLRLFAFHLTKRSQDEERVEGPHTEGSARWSYATKGTRCWVHRVHISRYVVFRGFLQSFTCESYGL